MNCPKCGSAESGVDFCTQCGSSLSLQSGAYTGPVAASRAMVVTAFVLAVAGLLVLAIPFGVTAIILSSISRSRGARGLATAALVIGIIDLAFGLLLLGFMGRFF